MLEAMLKACYEHTYSMLVAPFMQCVKYAYYRVQSTEYRVYRVYTLSQMKQTHSLTTNYQVTVGTGLEAGKESL